MPELPSSWGLKAEKRKDGRLDVVGKDDLGNEYPVRITDGPEITDKDVQELKLADRETYGNREQGLKDYVKYLTTNPTKANQEQKLEDDLTELAGPVVRVGLGLEGSTSRPFSRIPQWRWDLAFNNYKGDS